MKNYLQNLHFKRKLIEMVKKTDLSWLQQRAVINAILWRPDVVEQFKLGIAEGVTSQQALNGYVGFEGPFEEIDWENFDWEAAADFWVKLIEAIAKIILAVI